MNLETALYVSAVTAPVMILLVLQMSILKKVWSVLESMDRSINNVFDYIRLVSLKEDHILNRMYNSQRTSIKTSHANNLIKTFISNNVVNGVIKLPALVSYTDKEASDPKSRHAHFPTKLKENISIFSSITRPHFLLYPVSTGDDKFKIEVTPELGNLDIDWLNENLDELKKSFYILKSGEITSNKELYDNDVKKTIELMEEKYNISRFSPKVKELFSTLKMLETIVVKSKNTQGALAVIDDKTVKYIIANLGERDISKVEDLSDQDEIFLLIKKLCDNEEEYRKTLDRIVYYNTTIYNLYI